jgi:NhaP-type Na+/H+ or K+/H+ antiporter
LFEPAKGANSDQRQNDGKTSRYGLMEDYLSSNKRQKNRQVDSKRFIENENRVDRGSKPTFGLPLDRQEAAQAYYDDVDGGGAAAAAATDDNAHETDNNIFFNADELCSEYLFSFLEGITDAKDNCDGIQNAYIAAYCHEQAEDYNADDDHDDYFVKYNHFSCCQAIKTHYDSYCNRVLYLTNTHLLLVAIVLLLCEMAKSVIKFRQIYWLPEAGGCIIVGTLVGAIAHWMPSVNLEALSFDEDLFLGVLLPPIIFEAALSVNKKEFRRRRMAIFMFAVVGTILSTFMTGYMVHYASSLMQSVTTLPLLDSLIFGALISSIDPVAILSVLTSLNLTEEDTVFIMVFGESLLNDGVAITIFNSLLTHYNSEKVNTDEILGTIADFLIIGFGSIAIGIIFGFGALIYFWFLRKRLNAPMEVASFFLWAGSPYYVCDELELSGIVSIVTVGFFMDIYITTPKNSTPKLAIVNTEKLQSQKAPDFSSNMAYPTADDNYVEFRDTSPYGTSALCLPRPPPVDTSPSAKSLYSLRSIRSFRTLRSLNIRELLLREERFHLSREADKHVRFCAHLLAQLSENCIFVYLGLFLFSTNYNWETPLICVSIVSCLLSRSIMVLVICTLVWYINVFRQKCGFHHAKGHSFDADLPQVSRTAHALQDRRIQLVLVLSGLRGAVSLALVESVPIYNAVTSSGTEYKGIMKAMTSASIIFTIFVLGGSSYYILRNVDIKSADEKLNKEIKTISNQEMVDWKKKRPTPETPILTRKMSRGTTQSQTPKTAISSTHEYVSSSERLEASASYDQDAEFLRNDHSLA